MDEKNPYGIKTPRGRGPYKNNRRDEVVEAAIRLFSWHGFDGVSFKMLSEETGIAEGAIFKLFGGKENLGRICAAQVEDTWLGEVGELASMNLTYDEHTKRVCEIFKRRRDAIRFLISLSVTPKNKHLGGNRWAADYREKAEMLRPYENEMQPGDFYDLTYIMYALHLAYVVIGNEEHYESARQKLMKRFLKRE